MQDYTLVHNKEKQQFEFHIEGAMALIAYRWKGNDIMLIHTEVPVSLEGRGIASNLVLQVFQFVEKNDIKIIPLCPFVVAYLKRHTEWNRIVASR